MKTRRELLALGLCAAAGAFRAPCCLAEVSPEVRWIDGLGHRLREMSVWVRATAGTDGVAELHCGVADLERWVAVVPHLPDPATRVRAAGNAFSFTSAGNPVRVVVHSLPALA